MLAPLAQNLGYALISVRRFLAYLGYFRSYTHNGKWYTLRGSPRFNREGIWHHKAIGFSKHGSLTATIRHWVDRSPAGLSARELGLKLQHPCHPVLTHLHQDQVLDRVPVAGEFRYLSIATARNSQQREQARVASPASSATSLSPQAAVLVLVASIQHPELDFAQLAAHLRGRDLILAPEAIRLFFQAHGLKKTPTTPHCGS
jgi:hypothetical protein